MSSAEKAKKSCGSLVRGEVLDPLETEAAVQNISLSTAGSGMSQWERHRLEWQVRRERREVIQRLLQVESAVLVSEAIAMARGRVAAAEEAAELAAHGERIRGVQQAGRMHEEAKVVAAGLAEDSRELIAPAMDAVTVQYLRGVERRAAGME